jgi:hypothetical protein
MHASSAPPLKKGTFSANQDTYKALVIQHAESYESKLHSTSKSAASDIQALTAFGRTYEDEGGLNAVPDVSGINMEAY